VTEQVTLSFQLSDWTLAQMRLPVDTVRIGVFSPTLPQSDPAPPCSDTSPGSWGFMLRDMPIAHPLPRVQRKDGFLRCATNQYRHCYIDMRDGFDAYRQKFSSKTRSTIVRKVKRYTEHCGGTLHWACYSTAAEVEQFFPIALALSAKTYQERLLDAGLPADPSFKARVLEAAARGDVRAFLLFHCDQPVSYLFCPVEDEVVVYAYLGYDPAYKSFSVGTVLQWLALERLFGEDRFRYFDFTEGESDHKRLFATHEQLCANVLYLRDTLRARAVVYGHSLFTMTGESAGRLLDQWGLRAAVRRWLRFRSGSAAE